MLWIDGSRLISVVIEAQIYKGETSLLAGAEVESGHFKYKVKYLQTVILLKTMIEYAQSKSVCLYHWMWLQVKSILDLIFAVLPHLGGRKGDNFSSPHYLRYAHCTEVDVLFFFFSFFLKKIDANFYINVILKNPLIKALVEVKRRNRGTK